MSSALKHSDLPHYTYNDYIHWEGRWELIDGIPYAMSPAPSVKHQAINSRMHGQFFNLLESCKKCRATIYIDWKLREDTVLQPDLLVICHEETSENFITKPPELVAEILSPSTRHKDLGRKFQLYEEQKVKYYIIVDPVKDNAIVYQLSKDKFEKKESGKSFKFNFDLQGCEINFDFADIWK